MFLMCRNPFQQVTNSNTIYGVAYHADVDEEVVIPFSRSQIPTTSK